MGRVGRDGNGDQTEAYLELEGGREDRLEELLTLRYWTMWDYFLFSLLCVYCSCIYTHSLST